MTTIDQTVAWTFEGTKSDFVGHSNAFLAKDWRILPVLYVL